MPRFSANVSTLFTERPFLDRFAAARAAGFLAVEVQFPYQHDLADLVKARTEAGIEVVLINLPPGDLAAGERGLAALPGREDEFRNAVALGRRYAEALGCRRVHVMAGIVPDGVPAEACRQTFARNIAWAAAELAPAGIRALVEPINSRDMPGYLVNTTGEALAAIERADRSNLGLQYDLYHAQIMEGDLIPTLTRLLPRIGHIQFADTPGRHEPGTGEINFSRVFAAIDELGYDGWVGAEYSPSGRTEDSLDWLTSWIPRPDR